MSCRAGAFGHDANLMKHQYWTNPDTTKSYMSQDKDKKQEETKVQQGIPAQWILSVSLWASVTEITLHKIVIMNEMTIHSSIAE